MFSSIGLRYGLTTVPTSIENLPAMGVPSRSVPLSRICLTVQTSWMASMSYTLAESGHFVRVWWLPEVHRTFRMPRVEAPNRSD